MSNTPPPGSTRALETELQMARNTQDDQHAYGLIAYNLEVLLEGVSLAGREFKPLVSHCLRVTQTPVSTWKLARRVYRALNLGQYFAHSLKIPGARVECGTLNGFSALLLSEIAKAADPAFDGTGFHVVDSFEGLSEPKAQDAVAGRFANPAGSMACSLDRVRAVLRDYPRIEYHKGWIPEVLATLPETRWSFVHVDVDLYEPTLACLEYFLPRLAEGGVIVNDDYASPLFPGGGIAWDEYCGRHGLAYAALDTGQAVLVKGL